MRTNRGIEPKAKVPDEQGLAFRLRVSPTSILMLGVRSLSSQYLARPGWPQHHLFLKNHAIPESDQLQSICDETSATKRARISSASGAADFVSELGFGERALSGNDARTSRVKRQPPPHPIARCRCTIQVESGLRHLGKRPVSWCTRLQTTRQSQLRGGGAGMHLRCTDSACLGCVNVTLTL